MTGGSFRQHLAFVDPAPRWLYAGRGHRVVHRHLHRLVCTGPLLGHAGAKVVGPIPATAWIPLAMVLSPSAMFSAVALIALAVWFPVTMLTASGLSNTRASYLDVARTLGAGRAYLIFHVAIPAAMPSIFIGLFMGLGPRF